MMTVHRAFLLPLTLLLGLSIAGCGSDDSTTNNGGGNGGGTATVPASWGGTWQITTAPTAPFGSAVEVDIQSLCSGLSVEDLLGEGEDFGMGTVNCTGTWTDAAADVQCVTTVSFKGCTYTTTVTLDLTRSGETMMGTQTVTITSTPEGCAGPGGTMTWDLMGERLNTEQFGCGQDLSYTAPASWGGWWTITETPAGGRSGGGILVCPDLSSAEEVFYPGQFDASTTGGFQDGSAEVFGSWTETQGTCLWLYSEKISVTRTGTDLSGTREQTIRIIGDPNQGGECSDVQQMTYTITGSRISDDTSGCGFGGLTPFRELDPRNFRIF